MRVDKDVFIRFCGFLWGDRTQGWQEDLWGGILRFERERVFNEGLPYCCSTLSILVGTKGDMIARWDYQTTSGTRIIAYGGYPEYYEIVNPRDSQTRADYLRKALEGISYLDEQRKQQEQMEQWWQERKNKANNSPAEEEDYEEFEETLC